MAGVSHEEAATTDIRDAQSSLCREMPDYCTRFVKGGDVQNDDIPEAAAAIEPFLTFGEHIRTSWIGRCPTCHRAYLCTEEYEFIYGGSEDSTTSASR